MAMLMALPVGAVAVIRSEPTAAWHRVSFEGSIRSADRTQLEELSNAPLFFDPPQSYLVYLAPSNAASVRVLDQVSSVRPLSGHDRRSEAFDSSATELVSAVVARSGATSKLVGHAIAGWASDPSGALVTLIVPRSRVAVRALLAHPAVLSVGPASMLLEALDEQTSQISAGNITVGKPTPGYRPFLDGLGIDGTGVKIAIADSGIDDMHPDLEGRVVARTDFTALPDYRDTDGHGTHVAGIAAGSGIGLPTAQDPSGFAYGMGIAPAASLVDVGVLGIIEETVGLDDFPPFEQASSYAVREGAVGWNASWGSGDGDRVGYVENARTMDVLARDADWTTPGAQPFILVFAAGNSGFAGPGAPTEAKNLISVAASRSARAGNIETIASFSSRGPTRDGRIGPTIAAPGETIISTRATASVLCNTPPREASPLVVFYAACSGTSMAAPHVTGAVALLSQWWGQRFAGAVPSPAMVKAMLVNSAKDMGVADVPNVNEGWGRLHLKELFDPSVTRVLLDQVDAFDEVGESRAWQVEPIDSTRPMKITLAWSDAPAAPNASIALVNDLDLDVVAPNATQYRGNWFSGGWSIAGGNANRREVLENVYLASPSGTYVVRVTAASLPGDGVPYVGDGTDQDYALVLTNARIVG